MYDDEFAKLSRLEKIQQCANCHNSVHDNELVGPHFNAYKMLKEHSDYVNSSYYDEAFYTEHVNRNFEEGCLKCHAPDNMFETIFRNHNNEDSLKNWLLSQKHVPLTPRKDNLNTGVDCLTCHFDGTGVISSNKRFNKSTEISCNPKYSKFFSNISVTCYPCHIDEYNSMNTTFEKLNITGVNCNNCHQKTVDGKNTHYQYWTLGPEQKENRLIKMLASDFSLNLNTKGDTSSIIWNNTTKPHAIGLCPELVFVAEVLNKDSAVIASEKYRVNRKIEFDTSMYEYFGKNTLGGETGFQVIDFKSDTSLPFIIRNNKKSATFFRFSIIKKQQYWFPDSLGVKAIQEYKLIKPL